MEPVVTLVGATATGKSALAIWLAERLDGEIVNADALQVYRGLDIGTAKPDAAERQRVPHHLLDILEPDQPFSAGEFARRARRAIAGIHARGRLPLVVGGSGLYQRALFEGMSAIPEIDPAVREELRQRHAAGGRELLRAELERLDPATAARLAAGDTQRLLRALEVARATGRPLSAWLAEPPTRPPFEPVGIGLTLPRALLYDRVSFRVERMLAEGWVAEVQQLLDRGISPSSPAFQAIGYRQLAGHLGGEMTLEEAAASIVQATRRYAKRQLTWFRRTAGIEWFEAAEIDREAILAHLRARI